MNTTKPKARALQCPSCGAKKIIPASASTDEYCAAAYRFWNEHQECKKEMSRQVWRLELEDGNGPYYPFAASSDRNLHELIGLPWVWERHPAPEDDLPFFEHWAYSLKRDARFGFASLEQYQQWFFTAAARVNLARMGAQLVCYSVGTADILSGGKQVIFDRKNARKIEYRSPSRYHCFVGRQLEFWNEGAESP